MSEKHLTESPWKSLLTKQKLKDPGLGKALGAYEKLQDNAYDGRLEALDDIESEIKAAEKDKALKANDEVTKYLGEVEKEVPRARKTIEAAKAEAQESDEEEDEEGGADPGAIKKKIMGMLNQVKQRGPEDKQIEFMAGIAKGGSAVLLVKKAGSQKKLLQAMVPEASGLKFIKGECRWEENAFTFVVERVPGGLGKRLQKALFAETGIKHKVRVRAFDGSGVSDADAEQEDAALGEIEGETENESQEASAEENTPTTADEQANFLAKLKTLKPDIDKVIGGNVQASGAVRELFARLAGLAKARTFGEALAGWPELEKLVKTGLDQLSGSQGEDPAAAFRQRIAVLMPKIKEAIAANGPNVADLRASAGEAATLAKGGDYPAANKALDRAEALLGGGSSGGQPSAEAEWQQRFGALEGKYADAVRGAGAGVPELEKHIKTLQTLWAYATTQAAEGLYEKALLALARIEKEDLFTKIAQARGSGGNSLKGIIEKRKFLITRWRQIPPVLEAELGKLQQAIAAQVPDEDAADLTDGMEDYLHAFVAEIQAEIDSAINSGNMSAIGGLRNRITGNALVKHLFTNPFIPGSTFQSAMLDALSEVEANLAA